MALLTTTRQRERELHEKYSLCSKWIEEIENHTSNSLYAIMQQHRKMWADGVQHNNFGPDKYGMFRTDSIDNLTLDSLYLGNINGIWTCKASVFEKDDFKYKNIDTCKQLSDDYIAICQQYKRHLLLNLRAMRSNIYDHGYSRTKLQLNLKEGINLLTEGEKISDITILNKSIADNKVLDVEFTRFGKIFRSSVINIDGEFYFPADFVKGVKIEPSKIFNYTLESLSHALMRYYSPRIFSIEELKEKNITLTSDKTSEMSRAVVKENVKHVANYSKQKGVKFGM